MLNFEFGNSEKTQVVSLSHKRIFISYIPCLGCYAEPIGVVRSGMPWGGG
jgi:hypothetical protein